MSKWKRTPPLAEHSKGKAALACCDRHGNVIEVTWWATEAMALEAARTFAPCRANCQGWHLVSALIEVWRSTTVTAPLNGQTTYEEAPE